MTSSTTTCGGNIIVFWRCIHFYLCNGMFMLCVCRGDMWLLCFGVKKGSFHPVYRYCLFFAANVKVEKFVCVKARDKDRYKVD